MRSTLEITEAATDLQLLTIEEMRAAAGVTGSDQDAALQARGLSIAAAIMSECNIAVGNGGEPTLKQETLKETFYLDRSVKELLLARRHHAEILSVIVNDGDPLDEGGYYVEGEAGILTHICGRWHGRKIVVAYKAGFAAVPGDLRMAASDFYRATVLEGDRDPFVKSETVEVVGVDTVKRDYWVGSVPGSVSSDESAVPEIVSGQLKRFRNSDMG